MPEITLPVAGEKIKNLTATGRYENRQDGKGKWTMYWEFTCVKSCVKFFPVALVRRGRTGCGCVAKSLPEIRTYGIFTATGVFEMRPHKTDKPTRGGETFWEVICTLCGEKSFRNCAVVMGCRFKSCGCLQRARTRNLGKSSSLIPGNSSMRCLLVVYKHSAKKRGHTWSLTIDEFITLTKRSCHYCGTDAAQSFHPMSHGRLTIGGPYIYNGIDRFDNTVGYELSNCVPCCNICNVMKMAHSHEAFISHVAKINHHNIHNHKH